MGAQNNIVTNEITILVVEDDHGLNHLISAKIKDLGYTCISVFDLDNARDLILQTQSCFVLLDYSIGSRYSSELVEELHDKGIKFPFIVLTGYSDTKLAVDFMKLGAYDFLVKNGYFLEDMELVLKKSIDRFLLEKFNLELQYRLLKSEKLYRLMADNMYDIVCKHDLVGKFTYVSPSALNIFGYKPSELIGKHPVNFVHPEDVQLLEKIVADALNANQTWKIEYRFLKKNNEYLWVETCGTKTFDETEAIYEIQTVTRNIQERIVTEAKLKHSEKQFRAAFEYAAVGMSLRSLEGEIIVANNALCVMLGYARNELEGRKFTEFTYPDDLHLTASFVGKKPELLTYRIEKRYIHKNGNIVWTSVSSNILTDENNNPMYFIAQIQNITEQKKAEEIAKYDEARLESLLRIYEFHAHEVIELFDFALEEAIKLTQSKIGYIYFYNEETKQFTLNSWSKDVMKECLINEKQTIYDLDKTGIWGEAVRQRKTILINNFLSDNPLKKGYPEGHALLKKYLTIPVFYSNNIVAVVGVANKTEDYNEKDVRQLTLMMDSVWEISVRKKTEFELANRLEMEQLIAEISTEFVTSVIENISNAMHFVLSKIGNLTHADRAYIYIADKSDTYVNNTHEWYREGGKSWKDKLQNLKINDFPWWAEKIYKGEIINVSDVSEVPAHAVNERAFFNNLNVASQLFVPLVYANKVIGLIGVATLIENIKWSKKDIDFLKTISPIVASALNNADITYALKSSENRYRKLFDRLPDIVLMHHDGIITYANEAALSILGYHKSELLEKEIFEFVSGNQQDLKNILLGKFSGSELGLIEVEVYGKKEARICIVRTEIVKLEDKLLTLVLLSDITKRKELENKVVRNIDKQSVLNALLQLSLEKISLNKLLSDAFNLLTSIPWLSFEKSGCIFLMNSNGKLEMQVHNNLSSNVFNNCSIVALGECLCGNAAMTKKILFSVNRDDLNYKMKSKDNIEHGNYCVPILNNEEVLGVINIYLAQDHVENEEEKSFLIACSNTLAGLILRKRSETELANTLQSLESTVKLRTQQIVAKNQLLEDEIYERKQIEKALKLSEDKYRTIVEQSVFGIYIGNPKGNFIGVNSKGCEMSGYSQDEILTMNMSDFFTSEERNRVPLRYDLMNLGQTVINERELSRKDGSTLFIEMSTRKMKDGTYQAIFRDITDKKKAEEEIKLALEKEQDLNALKSRFISLVSHEFRTPLAGMLLSVELLEKYSEKWDASKKKEHYNKLYTSIRYTNMLLDDVSLMGKDDLGKLDCQAAFFNLTKLCYQTLDDAKTVIKNNEINISVEIAENMEAVFLDDSLVRHILTNLLTNAFKYSPDGKNVHFVVELKNEKVFIIISDEGIGIPDGDLKNIFERFHRAQNVSNIKGTGLGLSIVKRCVDLMSGNIRLESKVGVGTTVYVELPEKLHVEK